MGMTELLVILAVALLVLGPKRLPELASGLGKAIREFRKATRDLSDQMEVDDTIRKPMLELKAALRDEPPPPDAKKNVPLAPPGATIEIRPPDGAVAAGGLAAAVPPVGDAAPPVEVPAVAAAPAVEAVKDGAAKAPIADADSWDAAADAAEKSEPAKPPAPPAAKA
jgi:TatA/E family protein of Tat protein translocase